MPVSGDSIVQFKAGSSGGANVTTFDLQFDNTVQGGSAIAFFVAQDLQYTAPNYNGYLGDPSTDAVQKGSSPLTIGASHQIYISMFSTIQWTDRTNPWHFIQEANVTATPTAWVAVEIFRGVQPYFGVVEGSYPAEAWIVMDESFILDLAKVQDTSGTVSTLDSGYDYAAQTGWSPRRQIMFAAFGCMVTSGTPPTFNSFANTTAQPEDWIPIGTSVATSNSSGRNIQLSVAYKIKYESNQFTDCTGTWASAPNDGVAVIRQGYFSDWIPSERTLGRGVQPSIGIF